MRAISIAATSSFRLRRPGLDALRGHQLDGIAVAAHDAGLRRDVIGEDPVAAFGNELGLGIGGDVFGFGGKADHQLRPLRFAIARWWRGCRDFPPATSSGVAWPAFFLIFCSPALATRQSATAAAKIATSTGSARSTACSISRAVSTCTTCHARRIGQIHRPADQRHLGAGARRRRGNGVALLAGRAVGDIAHRIDRLVGRAGGDQHALALERLRRRWREQFLDRGGDLQRLGHAPECRARPLPPSRLRWGRPARRRRRRAARDCAASPCSPTCADSSPAPAGFLRSSPAARRWRDRRRGRRRAWPSGRRWPAPPRRDRFRARAEYGRRRIRCRHRTGR